MSKRTNLAAALLLAGVAIFLALRLLQDSSASRTDRSVLDRDGGADRPARRAGDSGTDGSIPDADVLRSLVSRYGGFRGTGRLVLTLPDAPGVGLDVVMEGSLDGWTLRATAVADADGRFRFEEMPRGTGYALSVEGPRVQSYRGADTVPAGPEQDFGEIVLNRYYFVLGRVVGGGDRGVAGAQVDLIRPAGGSNAFSIMQLSSEVASEDPVAAGMAAGSDGRFVLRLETPGIFTVRTRAEGWATHHRGDVVVGGAGDTELIIALAQGHSVFGRVLDGVGKPVSEATVTVFAMNMRDFSFPKEITRTDGLGEFSFRLEPTAMEYWLSVVPPRGAHHSRRFRVPLEEELVVRLPGGGVVVGRVLQEGTLAPVEGAAVLVGLSVDPANRQMPEFSMPVKSDGYGRFRVEGAGESVIQSVTIRAEGYADFRASPLPMFSTDADLSRRLLDVKVTASGETLLPDIVLKRGATLTGVVTDAAKRSGVAGARVELWDFLTGNRGVVTGPDGRYLFLGVGERVAMIVQAKGYADFRDPPFPGFALPTGATEAVRDLELRAGGSVAGTVRTERGAPVARALVRLRPAAAGMDAWMLSMSMRELWTHTREDGTWRIEGVPAAKVRAEAEAFGFDRGRSADREARAGETVQGFDIALQAAARAEGVVLARDGTPVAAARIAVARDPGASAGPNEEWRALSEGANGFTTAEGRFRVDSIPVGDVLIRIEAEGYATFTARRQGVPAGGLLESLRFELAPAFLITGRVLDPTGVAAGSTWVRAVQTASPDGEPNSQLLGARVEEDGTFVLRNLPAGSYSLEVRTNPMPGMPRYAPLRRENVPAGTRDVVLQLVAERPPS